MALRTPSEDGLQSMLKKVELCNIQAMQFIAANKFSAAEALLHRALNDSRNWGRLPSRKRSSSSAGQRKKKSRLANSKNPSQSMVIRLQGLELRAATFNNLALLYRTQKKLRPALMNAMKALRLEAKAPDSVKKGNMAGTHLNLCAILSDLRRHRSAKQHADGALRLLALAVEENRQNIEQSGTSRKYLKEKESLVAMTKIAQNSLGIQLQCLSLPEAAVISQRRAESVSAKRLGSCQALAVSANDRFASKSDVESNRSLLPPLQQNSHSHSSLSTSSSSNLNSSPLKRHDSAGASSLQSLELDLDEPLGEINSSKDHHDPTQAVAEQDLDQRKNGRARVKPKLVPRPPPLSVSSSSTLQQGRRHVKARRRATKSSSPKSMFHPVGGFASLQDSVPRPAVPAAISMIAAASEANKASHIHQASPPTKDLSEASHEKTSLNTTIAEDSLEAKQESPGVSSIHNFALHDPPPPSQLPGKSILRRPHPLTELRPSKSLSSSDDESEQLLAERWPSIYSGEYAYPNDDVSPSFGQPSQFMPRQPLDPVPDYPPPQGMENVEDDYALLRDEVGEGYWSEPAARVPGKWSEFFGLKIPAQFGKERLDKGAMSDGALEDESARLDFETEHDAFLVDVNASSLWEEKQPDLAPSCSARGPGRLQDSWKTRHLSAGKPMQREGVVAGYGGIFSPQQQVNEQKFDVENSRRTQNSGRLPLAFVIKRPKRTSAREDANPFSLQPPSRF